MPQRVETYRAATYPWHCDHQGHVTTMHYVGFFDAAGWQLVLAMGFPRSRLDAEKRGFVDAKAVIEYRDEITVGTPFHIESGLVKIGNSSVVGRHFLINSETGALVATYEVVMIYFDLEARQKVSLSETDKAQMASLLIDDQAS